MDTIILDVWNLIMDLFLRDGLIVLFVCFILGAVIKGSIKAIPNKFIPAITAGCGILLSLLLGSFSGDMIVIQIIKGAILGWSAVGLYECLCLILSNRFSISLKRIYNDESEDEEKVKNVKKKSKKVKKKVEEIEVFEEVIGADNEEVVDSDDPINVDDEE